jgi:radical SAM protein with 4Fe4S-binding SPASM domain
MVIGADGYVVPCCYWSTYDNFAKNKPLGNVNENSLLDIWNGDGYRKLRRNMARGDLRAAGCANCAAIAIGMELGLEYKTSSDSESPPFSTYAKNIRSLKEEVAEGRAVLGAMPTMIALTTSHKCNLRCIHCYQDHQRDLEIKREEVVEEILSLLPKMDSINALGGEPFYLPFWRDFLRHFDSKANPYLTFATCTNATLLTDEILDCLRKFNRLVINVSFDAAKKGVYEKIRRGANYELVVSNIEKLKKLVSQKPGSNLGTTISVMKANFKNIPDFIRFALDRDIEFGLSPVTNIPLDQAINCFNNPHEEMKGWREALDESRQILMDKRDQLTQEVLTPEASQSWFDFHNNNLALVEKFVPWSLKEKDHSPIELPPSLLQDLDLEVGKRYVLAFFPFSSSKCQERLHYAVPKENTYSVWLPEGEFCISANHRSLDPDAPYDFQRLVVSKGSYYINKSLPLLLKHQIFCILRTLKILVLRLLDKLRLQKSGGLP